MKYRIRIDWHTFIDFIGGFITLIGVMFLPIIIFILFGG